MKSLSYNQILPASAIGLGYSVSGAAAYNSGTTYSAYAVVTYGGYSYASKVGSNTGNTPAANSAWWIQVDPTSGIPIDADYALIQAETKGVRWRDDGNIPTTSIGMILTVVDGATPGTVMSDLLYRTSNLSAFKMIEIAATAKVNVTFYKS